MYTRHLEHHFFLSFKWHFFIVQVSVVQVYSVSGITAALFQVRGGLECWSWSVFFHGHPTHTMNIFLPGCILEWATSVTWYSWASNYRMRRLHKFPWFKDSLMCWLARGRSGNWIQKRENTIVSWIIEAKNLFHFWTSSLSLVPGENQILWCFLPRIFLHQLSIY